MNNLLIVIIIIVAFIWLAGRMEPLLGDIRGNPQRWVNRPIDPYACDTDYNDDDCKFVATNCAGNQNSLFVDAY